MQGHKIFAVTIAAAVACIGTSSLARADETIVSEIVTTGQPGAALAAGAPPKVVSTLYFKAGQWRTESGGAVMIAGGTDGKVYSLNPTDKTYFVFGASKAMAEALNNPMLSMVKFHSKADVHPAGETKTIAGKEAKSYKYSSTIHMSMGDGDDPATDAMLPTIKISGEEWASEALDLPVSPISGGVGAMAKLLPPPLSGMFSSLTTQLATIKGFPLVTTVTVNVVFPEGSPLEAMAGDVVPKAMVVKQTATSISEAPLSDDLFHVPSDYKLIDAPTPPGLPAPGGAPPAPTPATAPPVAPPTTP